jgi:hypothetical protein
MRVLNAGSRFEMRAPEIGQEADSGFRAVEWRRPLRRDRPAGAQSPGALRRGRVSGELAASETPLGPDRFLANRTRYAGTLRQASKDQPLLYSFAIRPVSSS